jgi:CyaY protein
MQRTARPAGLSQAHQTPVGGLVWRGSLLAQGCKADAKLLGPLRNPARASSLATQGRSYRYSDPGAWSLSFAFKSARSYLAALEPDQTLFEVAVMSLSEARFHDLVDATQQTLEDIFDDSDLDIDLESSAGVLTVKFENGTQLIFSRQEPLRQLWLAAVSGGFHFDYDEESERWMCDKSEEQLGEMLERIVQQQADTELDFEGL